jgi:hypothetical protein
MNGHFVAVHESVSGPERRFAADGITSGLEG